MTYTRVKICGITTRDDALAAIAAGADALGFVFYPPSPRHVEVNQVREIVRELPAFVSTVGLFVDASVETVVETVQATGLTTIQLHGDESPAFCQQLAQATALPVIKAIRVAQAEDGAAQSGQAVFYPEHPNAYESVQAVLLDTYSKSAPGGTGHAFNWDLVPECDKPMILAGGLSPETVAGAIEQVKPYAVDVSGGVEHSLRKGVKDAVKVAAFVTQAKQLFL